jgi:hypothetical protein
MSGTMPPSGPPQLPPQMLAQLLQARQLQAQRMQPPGAPQGMPMPPPMPPQGMGQPPPQMPGQPFQPGQGLLAQSDASYRPPPLPQVPGLLRPVGVPTTASHAMMFLQKAPSDNDMPDDASQLLPPQVRSYAAMLRQTVQPAGIPWQQEIIYQKLGKDDREIEGIAQYYYKNAQNYDMALSRERVTASDYYAGRPLGDEVKGRSRLVMTVVRDTIRSTLPSMLRVFTGVEDPVSFEPISSEITGNDALATTLSRQATDYARWALFTANHGWQVLHDCLLDALTRKAGWVRWHWGKKQQQRTETCEGLLLPQLQLLLSEPGIEAQRIVRRPMTRDEQQAAAKSPDGGMYFQQGGAPEYWSAVITRTAMQAWPVVEAIPAECVWVVSDADTVESARGIFHVRDVTASDLIEMGLPEYDVLSHGNTIMQGQQRREAIARNPAMGANLQGGPPNDRSMALVRYVEGWIRCDADNDHHAELLHVHLLGNAAELVQWERVDEIPLACFTPYREPGMVIGSSQADMVMDLQRIETRVMRATLDSLAQSMFPRTVVTLGQVNMADVRQTAVGSVIRVAQQGAVTELTRPFGGREALPVLEVLESVRESRTGITRASSGLTIDQLQSTAPIAVSQQANNAQDRLDMMARTLAETGLAPLYSGLLKLMASHQDRPNVIRIRGEWATIDPRALNTMWEATVNIGGKGMPMERLAMLAQLAQKQEMIIQQGGLNNPLVGIPEYRNTLARMLETVNISDVSSYFKPLPPGWQPPPQQSPGPTDSQLLAASQDQKNAADLETDRGKAQTDRAKMLVEDDRERDKAALDAWAKTWVAAAQFGTPVPSLTQFQTAMRSKAPQIGLMANVPPPTSPQPPATGQQAQGPQPPPGGPPRPPGPPPQQMPPQGMMPPQRPPGAPPMPDPATAMAAQRGLAGGGLPSAYGQIANRAVMSTLFGMGGPRMPPPGAGQGAGPPGP